MKFCQKCNLEYDDKFAFCQKCGSKLEIKQEKPVCSNCGKVIETDGDFCPFCGSAIVVSKPVTGAMSASVIKNSNGAEQTNNNSNTLKKIAGIIIALIVLSFGVMYFASRNTLYDMGILEPSTVEEQCDYARSLWTKKDYKGALKWYKISAEQGYDFAQFYLAMMYHDGQGTEKDDKEAFKWLKKAAESKITLPMYHRELATFYATGTGVEKNYKEAFKWYNKAAEKGDRAAEFYLGLMYKRGQGTDKNNKEAFKWFKKAADQGHLAAQFNLGMMYGLGEGVEENPEEAFKWLKKAADSNEVRSQLAVGMCYKEGGLGVKQNKILAKEYLEKAAKNGNERAKEELKNL